MEKGISLQFVNLLFLGCVLIFSSCESGPGKLEDILQGTLNVAVNPFGKVPLGAQVKFRTREEVYVTIEIPGDQPVRKTFPDLNTIHAVPVIGLYPDKVNLVTVTVTNSDGRNYTGTIEIKTPSVSDFLPTMQVVVKERRMMEPGFHLTEMLIANNGKFHTYTMMFDDSGVVRWFMDMSSVGQISYSPLRLSNGNWLYVSWIDIWELSSLGEEIRHEKMWRYAGNHHIIEMPSNQLLMGGSKSNASVRRGDGQEIITRYDYVVLWDRDNNEGVKEWDLGAVLDIDRSVFPEDYTLDFKADWFHLNGIAMSPDDKSLLVSGRNQGVLKVDPDNNLKWILAPHREWGRAGRSGNGFVTSDYLLTAIDSSGNPLPPEVQDGAAGTNDFEWSTGQHAVSVLENGNVLLFDNGLARNFNTTPTYSRAVEYEINEENMTIRQVWEYGKSRGLEMYSPITSDVDVLPQSGNRLITAGNVRATEQPPHARMIEITYPDKEVVFDAMIFFKDAKGTGAKAWGQFDLVFRGERYSLYH